MNYTGISDYVANNPMTYSQPISYEDFLWDKGIPSDDPSAAMQYQAYVKDMEMSNSMITMAFTSFVKLQQDILQDMRSLR